MQIFNIFRKFNTFNCMQIIKFQSYANRVYAFMQYFKVNTLTCSLLNFLYK